MSPMLARHGLFVGGGFEWYASALLPPLPSSGIGRGKLGSVGCAHFGCRQVSWCE